MPENSALTSFLILFIMTQPFHFQAGSLPLLVSMPHVGTRIPDHLLPNYTDAVTERSDTDWHLPTLYSMLDELGASRIHADYSRYVIDLNRPSDDVNLYPGQDTTGLCPVDTFSKQALYHAGQEPSAAQIQERIAAYWQPYHQQIQDELARIKSIHGIAILWDAHSIASQVPRFFEGRLPDLNFGTANQTSCALSLQTALADCLKQSETAYSHVFNGRFKGGYITRHYGQPEQNIHAVQLEMSQIVYMDEHAPYAYRADLAAQVQPLLKQLLQSCLSWAQQNSPVAGK